MRPLYNHEKAELAQALREGFCWSCGALVPFLLGLIVAFMVVRALPWQ